MAAGSIRTRALGAVTGRDACGASPPSTAVTPLEACRVGRAWRTGEAFCTPCPYDPLAVEKCDSLPRPSTLCVGRAVRAGA
jgi:hypothetical protein